MDAVPEDSGLYDEEDGVYRCMDCLHEIWGSVCSGCHRVYQGHAESGDSDDDDDVDFYGLANGPGLDMFQELLNSYNGLEEELSDIDEEGYEHSFIDDDSDAGADASVPNMTWIADHEPIDIRDDGSGSEGGESFIAGPVVIDLSSDESSGEEEQIVQFSPGRRLSRLYGEDLSDSSDNLSSPANLPQGRRWLQTEVTLLLSDDDVFPVQRAGRLARRRFAIGDSDEESNNISDDGSEEEFR